MSGSRIITVSIDVEVRYITETTSGYGADADDNRGVTLTEYVPITAEILEGGLPQAVAAWAKTRAIEIFEEQY
jgi:hypothetical protein